MQVPKPSRYRLHGAILAAMLLCATMVDVAAGEIESAWQGTSWGERSSELARYFGARATVLSKPIDFGDSYVDIVLRNRMIGGFPFTVFFQMDKATHGLKRVQIERQRHGANPRVARALLREVVESYGAPDQACNDLPRAGNGYQESAERLWRRDGTLIWLIFRDTTIEASEGCIFGDPSAIGACGLTGQLLLRISPDEPEADRCR